MVKIGLVTSGLTEKAMPEIVSAFAPLGWETPSIFMTLLSRQAPTLLKGRLVPWENWSQNRILGFTQKLPGSDWVFQKKKIA